MKYRSDFVTNSSSSSFIICYNTPSDMIKDIRHFVKEHPIDEWDHQYKDVVYDLFNNHITYTEALRLVKEALESMAYCKMVRNLQKQEEYQGYTNWINSKEFKECCKEYVEEGIEKFKSTVNKRGYFAYLQYSDHDGYYDVEPHLQNMLKGVYLKIDEH